MNTTASGNTLTITGELASTTNIGVAKFTSDNFTVTSGEVEVSTIDGGIFLVFNVIKKWFDSVLKSYDKQPKFLSGKKKSVVVRVGDLQYKTKKELEIIGRKIGIELDRRYTKQKLINKIKFKAKNRNR